jgi:hypothetical protein
MKFNTNPSIKRIHDIHNILLDEPLSAYEVANEMSCKRPIIYFYIIHMLEMGYIKEMDKKRVARYQAVREAKLPDFFPEKKSTKFQEKRLTSAKDIVPFRDPWLFSLFRVK